MKRLLLFSFLLPFGCSSEKASLDQDEELVNDLESGRLKGITEAHNLVRQEKGIPDLEWDEDLVTVSEEWLSVLVEDNCAFEHNWDSEYGENLYWSNYESTAENVVQAWASEEQFYDYENNTCEPGEMCGHYTQIVWEDTTHVGCAIATCDDGSEIWMCNYSPAGNWTGEWPY